MFIPEAKLDHRNLPEPYQEEVSAKEYLDEWLYNNRWSWKIMRRIINRVPEFSERDGQITVFLIDGLDETSFFTIGTSIPRGILTRSV